MAPKKKVKASYCWNCGQEVDAATADTSVTPGVAFCCNCGLQLDANGKCRNDECQFCGQVPNCGP